MGKIFPSNITPILNSLQSLTLSKKAVGDGTSLQYLRQAFCNSPLSPLDLHTSQWTPDTEGFLNSWRTTLVLRCDKRLDSPPNPAEMTLLPFPQRTRLSLHCEGDFFIGFLLCLKSSPIEDLELRSGVFIMWTRGFCQRHCSKSTLQVFNT